MVKGQSDIPPGGARHNRWRGVSPALRRVASVASGFRSDERGTIAIIFALMTVVVVSMVGGAVDFGRAVTARDQIQNAVDASVLAAGRVWQTEKDLALAEEKALKYYAGTKPTGVDSSVTRFEPDLGRNAIVMEARAHIPAPFLSMLMADGFSVSARAEALLAVGGNAETHLEISMMLDVTGSMSGQKLADLKLAAKDLIDIVVWEDQSEYTSRVALAPFSDRVNAGPYASAVTGLPATRVVNGNTRRLRKCVTDRWGVAQHRDDVPAANPNTYVGPYAPANGNSPIDLNSQYSSSGSCSLPEIMPLTRDKAALKARIDSFVASGSTAGALGTEWAWFLLSPNWSSIWPEASRPVAYNTPQVQKIAILMTDGEYNYYKGQSWSAASVSAFAKNTCREMKVAGVTVYTIGFQLDSNRATDVLRDCASDPTKFYEADDGGELRQAFRDIALQVAKLRLSQ